MNMPTVKQLNGQYQILRAAADGWEIELCNSLTKQCEIVHNIWLSETCSELRVVPDENGWLPWYAAGEFDCPSINGKIDYIMISWDRPATPEYVPNLSWVSGGLGEITHYRPHKERGLIKTVLHYDDGSSEEA